MLLCMRADRTTYLARVALGRQSWRAAIFMNDACFFQALDKNDGSTGVSMGIG